MNAIHQTTDDRTGEDSEPFPETERGIAILQLLRRIVIFMLGMGVLILGVVMIVTPGPAFLIIPLGLAILATEFVWARRLLERVKERMKRLKKQADGA